MIKHGYFIQAAFVERDWSRARKPSGKTDDIRLKIETQSLPNVTHADALFVFRTRVQPITPKIQNSLSSSSGEVQRVSITLPTSRAVRTGGHIYVWAPIYSCQKYFEVSFHNHVRFNWFIRLSSLRDRILKLFFKHFTTYALQKRHPPSPPLASPDMPTRELTLASQQKGG